MQPLNAFDAIAPAFTRTHEVLFRPLKIGRAWKLAATQYLGLMGAFFFPLLLLVVLVPREQRNVALVAGAGLLTLIFFALFYVGVRLQFVNFEMLVLRGKFVAPMWRRYGARTWPVIGFKIVLGTVLTLLVTPFVYRFGSRFFATLQTMPKPRPGQSPDPQLFRDFLSQMILFYAIFFVVFKLFSTLFEDFALPFYILEDIPLVTSLSRGLDVFLADPLQCVLYLAMKFILSAVGFIAQYIANLICLIPAAVLMFFVVLIGALVVGHSVAGKVIAILGGVILYAAFIAYSIFAALFCIGYLFTLLEGYAIYFLGGRYPRLGDLLEPPAIAYPFTPPPVFPSQQEIRDDDDDGPSLPMNPALA